MTYGDEPVWESLAAKDQPFFQLKHETAKVDWSIENEWRVVGDVDLKQVPPDAGLVFVPTLEDAREIGLLSRWPVVVLSEEADA